MIAFFGMGLLGSNFVRAALRRGESVQVWSRDAAKARALEADGARAFADAAEAARGAERIHLTLSDDASVDAVLAQLLPGAAADAIVIDHTTTSAAGARARAERLGRGPGPRFVHAPVFMGPQNALEANGTMLVSGDRALFERVRPALSAMTGKLADLGPEPDRAAQFKLMGNLFLMFVTEGVGETLGLGAAFGIPPQEAAKLFQIFNPGQALPARVSRILTESAPSWHLQMARKDARLMLEAAEQASIELSTLPSIAAAMDRSIERGHGQDDWTVVARENLKPRTK